MYTPPWSRFEITHNISGYRHWLHKTNYHMITATTASTYIWYTSASYNLKLVMKYRIVTLGLYIIITYSYILFIRRMPLVDRELLTFLQQFSSPPSWSGSLVVQSYFSVLYGSLLVCLGFFLREIIWSVFLRQTSLVSSDSSLHNMGSCLQAIGMWKTRSDFSAYNAGVGCDSNIST